LALAQGFVLIDKSKHDVKSFDCGKPEMNQFLARFAINHQSKRISKTWVLTELTDKPKEPVVVYFTLTSSNVTKEDVPIGGGYPNYPLPVILLARLAVDKNYSGKGLGSKSLVAAIREAVSLTTVGLNAVGIILDVLDNEALGFYQKMGIFNEFTNDPMRLFMTMNEATKV